jgi:predicted CxxxxCH...CXXCH cytochrome family protein
VGAHARHLALQGDDVRLPIACEECHRVPSEAAGHAADGVAAVEFLGPLAGGRPGTRWDAATGRCENVYCHGATLRGGSATAPEWTRVDWAQLTCGSCHGAPPESHAPFRAGLSCDRCHPGSVRADGAIDLAAAQHVDGATVVPAACDGCHLAPPDTGAHRAHASPAPAAHVAYGSLAVLEDVSPAGGAGYRFGCGHCHPLDPADHLGDAGADGLPDVALAPPATPVAGDEVKSRNDPAASWSPADGTCSGVYCHSSGQELPAYASTPAWTAGPGALGCDGCHGNPPRYPSGGAGASDANGHLGLQEDGYEWGHFGGLPGPWHTSKHGGGAWGPEQDAAPITCQTCHYDTTDPAATGPSGFYWLDTTGDHVLPGGLLAYACGACHGRAGGPAAGSGRVLPLRHVNGRRDVVFDPRTTLPDVAWLPAPPNRPTRPYWVTNALPGLALPDPAVPDTVLEGTTMSLHLGSATYDRRTKTCSGIGCHLLDTTAVWGAPHEGQQACSRCHPF